jgi:hypothetical protein
MTRFQVGIVVLCVLIAARITDGWSRAAYCFAVAVPALIAAISAYWIGVFDANATELLTESRMRCDGPIGIDHSRSQTAVRSF